MLVSTTSSIGYMRQILEAINAAEQN